MFQMGGIGPMLGQAHHFLRATRPSRSPTPIDRYTKEAEPPLRRARPAARRTAPYLAGDVLHRRHRHLALAAPRPSGRASSCADYPNVKRWFDAIAARPAVERGLSVFADKVRNAPMDAKAKEILFGAAQYQQH